MTALVKAITALEATAGNFTVTATDIAGIQIGSHVSVAVPATPAYAVPTAAVTAVTAAPAPATTGGTVEFHHDGDTIAPVDVTGTLTVAVEWTTHTIIEKLLGYSPTGGDLTYLEYCTDAANGWAWARRQQAGYTGDQPSVVPDAQVQLGTSMYGMVLYRERGSVDSFSSFDGTPTASQFGSMGQINRLLGIGRSQVG
ncbi:hypothetical protein UFOVP1659_6 [uncultured Caudovirales phage]|uniref:Uncharacterized protein n=1 Tax=uncultured Caudovirales phage TaxID=2100421 RepID=A0A6J5QF40_9CAUD|nr:hypothetical protein UFOVP1056_9 [uncultured Caudovirales phage]CAB4222226.1 hypothetical protein UFOVP1659_6 [uncultured Caudovirales phage]